MFAKAIGQRQTQDEQMSWRAAVALWVGLAALGWMAIGAVVSALL